MSEDGDEDADARDDVAADGTGGSTAADGRPGGSDSDDEEPPSGSPTAGEDATGTASGTDTDGDDGDRAAVQADAADEVDTDAADEDDPRTLSAALEPPVDATVLAGIVGNRDADTVANHLAALAEENDMLESDLAAAEVEVDEREATLDDLRAEREDLEERLKRKQAEFQNFKKRQEKRREEATARATEDLVERLLEVRDNLVRALEQEADADIREGVEATLRQLDDVLDAEDVEPIEPEPGADVDPTRHEVLLTVESDRPAGTVDAVQRPGYEMAGKVIRPAGVTVADDPAE